MGWFVKETIVTGPKKVLVDRRLREALMQANMTRAERVAFLVGIRRGEDTVVVAAAFPPLQSATAVGATFDMRWWTVMRSACEELEIFPDAGFVGWMHSHPRMSIFLSSIDQPTAAAFRREDAETVAVVINPYSTDDPIGAFSGTETASRIPVEFRFLHGISPDLLDRLAALPLALPEWPEVIVPERLVSPALQSFARAIPIRRLVDVTDGLTRFQDNIRQSVARLEARIKELELLVQDHTNPGTIPPKTQEEKS